MNKLEEVILMFCMNYLMTSKEKNSALGAFTKLDTNGDGQLSIEEVQEGKYYVNIILY